MSDEAIIIRLRNILRDNSAEEYDWDQVNGDTTIESLGIDSLSILDLLYDIDQEFDIQLEGADVVDTRTVGEIAALLKQRGA
ncbi:MAG: acyl carrier protein [Acidobacteriota bacterium]